MLRIGDFSRVARVSARLLRYYEQIGLFAPACVDESTGYRYYSANQLPQLNRILALRELGLSLEQIQRFVDEDVSTDELRRLLLLRRAEVEERLDEERRRLLQIESRLEQIDAAGHLDPDADIVVKALPAEQGVALRLTLDSPAAAMRTFEELLRAVARLREADPFTLLHGESFELDQLDIEFGVLLPAGYALPDLTLPAGALRPTTLPAVEQAATAVRIGPPDRAHRATGQIARWIEAQGYQLAGPNRERFIERPAPGRLAEAIVEMQFPIIPRILNT